MICTVMNTILTVLTLSIVPLAGVVAVKLAYEAHRDRAISEPSTAATAPA